MYGLLGLLKKNNKIQHGEAAMTPTPFCFALSSSEKVEIFVVYQTSKWMIRNVGENNSVLGWVSIKRV